MGQVVLLGCNCSVCGCCSAGGIYRFSLLNQCQQLQISRHVFISQSTYMYIFGRIYIYKYTFIFNGFANIPSDTPDFPKLTKGRTSFMNYWPLVWGMFQGYVGKSLHIYIPSTMEIHPCRVQVDMHQSEGWSAVASSF